MGLSNAERQRRWRVRHPVEASQRRQLARQKAKLLKYSHVQEEAPGDMAARMKAEVAKTHLAGQYTKEDFDAAETLIENAMINLGSTLSAVDKARMLEELRTRLATKPEEAQSLVRSRALGLLNQARNSNKSLALSDCERFLFVMCKAAKVAGPMYWRGHNSVGLVHPHKLLCMLISGRSSRWYDRNHKKLLDSMCVRTQMTA
jgi:hypothetical protein